MPHRAFREVVVLRELEGLSYKEIAAVIGTPIKTVMSRLLNDTELDQFIHYLEMR
jgi:DNA-directed RNA polymerase specialized sigma24 family protein